MASITVRNLDDDLKRRLRVIAAENNRSMEEEVRIALRDLVERESDTQNLVEIAREYFPPGKGVKLEPLPREPIPEPPSFK